MNTQNLAYTYKGIYSASKRKEILIHVTMQMNHDDIMLKKPDTKGPTLYGSTHETPRIVKSRETESRIGVVRGWEKGGMGSYLMGTEFLFDMIKMF